MLKIFENGLRRRIARHFPGVPLFAVLHPVPNEAELAELLTCLAQIPSFCLLAWRRPERNLDFPAFWLAGLGLRLIGQSSRRAAFLRMGGAEGILMRVGKPVSWQKPVFCGAATLAVCGKAAGTPVF